MTLERLDFFVRKSRHRSMILDIFHHNHGPVLPFVSLALYETGRDFEDGLPVARGEGETLEVAMNDMLTKADAL
jgi:hypothetical protein